MGSEPVYISDLALMAPGINSMVELDAFSRRSHPTPRDLSVTLDQIDEEILSTKEGKAMRKEVFASMALIDQLFKSDALAASSPQTMPLYLATGLSFEGYADQIDTITAGYVSNPDKESAQKDIYKGIHPLFALKTLTNAAASYLAQSFGVRGRNTTMGATSYASFQGLKEGVNELTRRGKSVALVGASNETALFSHKTYGSVVPHGTYIEGADCFVYYVLESESALERRGGNPLCRIRSLESSARVDTLLNNEYTALDSGKAFVEKHQKSEEVLFTAQYRNAWTAEECLSETAGNYGVANLLYSGALAVTKIENADISSVDCFDMDCYGRLSLLSLERV